MSFIALDLEIKTSPLDHPEGWAAARRGDCGVSAVCLYHSESGCYHLFDDHNLRDVIDFIREVDTVVTFNGADFDLPCLEGVLGEPLPINSQYDILQEIWAALGGRRKGYKLDQVCQRTLGFGKMGNGEFATVLYARGRFAELFTYCMHDVYLTQTLFEHIMATGCITDVNGDKLQLGDAIGEQRTG